jgi:head-tail adaptor
LERYVSISGRHTKKKNINGKMYIRWREYKNPSAAIKHLEKAEEMFYGAKMYKFNPSGKFVIYVLRKM